MESCRKEDFSETGAVHKGEFRNFLDIGVAKVYTLKQSATVACMRSDTWMTGSSCKNLVDSANLLESLHVR